MDPFGLGNLADRLMVAVTIRFKRVAKFPPSFTLRSPNDAAVGRIQSQFGLVTGTDILGTVDALVAISARPRDRLITANETLAAEQAALTELTASVIGVQLAGGRLATRSAFRAKTAEVSDQDALSASAGSAATAGRYTVRTLAAASTQQFELVGGFDDPDAALGLDGEISLNPSGFLGGSSPLSSLNDGRGVQSGSFRITDRGGNSAVIDVSGGDDIDAVIDAINDADIGIRAGTSGGRITIADTTGRTDSNLKLEQLGNAETLADLGLHGINVAADSVTSSSLLRTTDGSTRLSELGVDLSGDVDFAVTLSDGTPLDIKLGDFSIAATPPTPASGSTAGSSAADAGITFTEAVADGTYEGLNVRFEQTGLLETASASIVDDGGGNDELLIKFDAGSTASDIVTLVNNDLAGVIDAVADGTGSGNVQATDTATLAGFDAGDPGQTAIADPTLDDLAAFINAAYGDRVTATIQDGNLQLEDLSGGGGTFAIADGPDSSAATDLRINRSTTGNQITGTRSDAVLRGTSLDVLGGGDGLGTLGSLEITLSDSTTVNVDLSGARSTTEVIDAITAANPALIARINDAGTGLRIRDTTDGSTAFSVSSIDDTAAKLGLDAAAKGSIIEGRSLDRRSIDRATRLDSLDRGRGITEGSFTITDSDGTTSAVNLRVDAVETVGDLIDRINTLGINVNATLSPTGDGIAIVDTGGGSQTLSINDSGGDAATRLGLAGDPINTTIDGQNVTAIVGRDDGVVAVASNDSLRDIAEKLNATEQVTAEVFTRTDGRSALTITSTIAGAAGRLGLETLLDGFEFRQTAQAADAKIAYSIDGGAERFATSADGVFDLAEGTGTTLGGGTTLESLGISRGSFTITDSAGGKSAINIAVEAITTVGGLVDRINDLNIDVTASIDDDTGALVLRDNAGGDGDFEITDVGTGSAAAALGIAGITEADDEGLRVVTTSLGDGDGDGLSVTLKSLSDDPITIEVESDPDRVIDIASTFVDQFNAYVDKAQDLTFFDANSESTGLLFGSGEVLRVTQAFERLLSGNVRGAGEIRSIGSVGLSFTSEGKLRLNRSKFRDALSERPAAVEQFFTTKDNGLAARLDAVADRAADAQSGILLNRRQTLQNQSERNDARIESLSARLESERERLLLQFYRSEEAISRIQSDQSAVASIQRITIPS